MKTKKIIFMLIIVVISVLFSAVIGSRIVSTSYGEKMRDLLYPLRSRQYIARGSGKQAKQLYQAIDGLQAAWVETLLKEGADPNYCVGEFGWVDANPLATLSAQAYTTAHLEPDEIPEHAPDELILHLLVNAGGDINARPNIWYIVHTANNAGIEKTKELWKDNDVIEEITSFISDANRSVKLFVEAGANPDILGHPYPYSREAFFAHITDEQAKEYFAKGKRAINEAIEKGIVWESQVDLLLEYTTLDEESLKAAERSGDPAMVEKISTLWEKQHYR